jgi:hypothetical protein
MYLHVLGSRAEWQEFTCRSQESILAVDITSFAEAEMTLRQDGDRRTPWFAMTKQ